MILICVICGIVSMLVYQKLRGKKLEKRSFMKAVLFNFLASLSIYSYYIGYSLIEIEAALVKISPNAFYFAIISVGAGVITVCLLLGCDKLSQSGSKMIDYHLTRADKVVGGIALLLAVCARVIGVNWGAGVTFHPDEGNVIRTPITMANNNTMMADYLFYPSQITSKVLCVAYELLGVLGRIFDFEVTDLMCVYTARIYVSLLSVGTVACIFLIGNHYRKHAGTIAALLAAVFPSFIYAAHCVIGDNFVTLCIGLIILCALNYLETEQESLWLFAMSVVAALAMLDKYHGMILCALIAIVVCAKKIKQRQYGMIILQGCMAVGTVLLAIVIIAPNLVINLSETIESVLFLIQNDTYDEGATFTSNLSAYSMWFIANVGVLSIIPMVVGLYRLIKEHRLEAIVLSIGLVELVAMCLQTRHYIRWGLPIYLVLFVIVGIGVIEIVGSVGFQNKRWIRVLSCVGFVLLWLNGFVNSLFLDLIYLNSNLDTRIVAEEWFKKEGIREEECIYDSYTCWQPGGMIRRTKYPWRYGISIVDSTIELEEELWINHLGRKYAVENLGSNKSGILDNYEVERLVYYEADCHEDGAFWEANQNISVKVFELYSIADALRKSYQILSEQIYLGDNIVIYDISNISAFEQYEISDFELVQEEKREIYVRNLESISKGRYSVMLEGNEEPIQILLEDKNGNVIQLIDVRNRQTVFELKEDCYNLTMKLLMAGESNLFDYLKIETLRR